MTGVDKINDKRLITTNQTFKTKHRAGKAITQHNDAVDELHSNIAKQENILKHQKKNITKELKTLKQQKDAIPSKLVSTRDLKEKGAISVDDLNRRYIEKTNAIKRNGPNTDKYIKQDNATKIITIDKKSPEFKNLTKPEQKQLQKQVESANKDLKKLKKASEKNLSGLDKISTKDLDYYVDKTKNMGNTAKTSFKNTYDKITDIADNDAVKYGLKGAYAIGAGSAGVGLASSIYNDINSKEKAKTGTVPTDTNPTVTVPTDTNPTGTAKTGTNPTVTAKIRNNRRELTQAEIDRLDAVAKAKLERKRQNNNKKKRNKSNLKSTRI